jgi:hypothetical protein
MKSHLNLLPIGFLRARLVRRRLALWAPVWAAVGLLAVANWWTSYSACAAAAHTFEIRQQQYEPTRKLSSENSRMRQRIDELNNRETMLGELSESHPPLAGVTLVGRCAAQCEGRVRVHHLLLERNVAAASNSKRKLPGAQSAAAGDRSQLTLEGVGLDNVAVATFVESLRDTGAFLNVELKSTIRSGDESGAMRQFVVVCEY